ncbi:hypothetical protein F4777DRAFT_216442 [Nemania sp. FL0916]|nr:hypothetical protein F4777DRAFT_216442 [Nemania sp. FL0916]
MSNRGRQHQRSHPYVDILFDALQNKEVRDAITSIKKPSRAHEEPPRHSRSRGHGHGPSHGHSHGHGGYPDSTSSRRSRHHSEAPEDDEGGYYRSPSPRPQRRHRSAYSDRHPDDHHRHPDDHDDRHHHHHHSNPPASGTRSSTGTKRRAASSHAGTRTTGTNGYKAPDLAQAATAAIAAGVVEAWRSRKDANKTMRIATAALGAAATDSALGRGDGRFEKSRVLESALAGLVETKAMTGR